MHVMASRNHQNRVGRRLKAARLKTGMTQDDAAVALRGILPPSRRPTGSQISRIESGAIKEPQVYVVAALARVYKKPLNEIAPELLGEAIAVKALLRDVVDLTECAPWELNPQPADYRSVAVQPSFFDDDWDTGGSSEPRIVIDLRDLELAS